jgi:hypothetical protein
MGWRRRTCKILNMRAYSDIIYVIKTYNKSRQSGTSLASAECFLNPKQGYIFDTNLTNLVSPDSLLIVMRFHFLADLVPDSELKAEIA